MAVWPFLMALCVACLGWAALQRDTDAATALVIALGAYVVTRILVVTSPDIRLDIQLALIWLLAAKIAIWSTDLRVFPYCLSLMSLWYFIAYVIDAPRAFGSWPYVVIDLLAIGAMVGTAWNAGDGGNRVLDRYSARSAADSIWGMGERSRMAETSKTRIGGDPL